MAQGQLIVAHFLGGKILKGISLDVSPKRPRFHLRPAEGEVVEIPLSDLKALYFVRTEAGQPTYNEVRRPVPGDPRLIGSKRVKIVFTDREELHGLVSGYPPASPFYFVQPVDPKSNNLRILVNADAVRQISEESD